jgi:hypothetical protein
MVNLKLIDGRLLCVYDGKNHFVVLNKLIIKAQLIGKPVSCHLYPVRIKDFTEFAAVNYDKVGYL